MNTFNENDHPRDKEGKFSNGDKYPKETRRFNELMGDNATTVEKIASVKIEKGKDSILPMLNESELQKIGASTNKPILVKATSFDYNEFRHLDAMIDCNRIVGETLYSPSEIFNGNKEGYHVFAKVVRMSPKHEGEVDFCTVLLDVNETKDNFEVVHWHYMRPKDLERAKNKNIPPK